MSELLSKTFLRFIARILFAWVVFAPVFSFAAMPDVIATPAVVDGKGKARDILHYSLVVVNTSKHAVSVYPWVTDFDPTVGSLGTTDLAGSSAKPLSESLARWVEITRGSVDLLPGEQKEIPLTVQVNLNAKPGVYHATINLSQGNDRASAEAHLETTQSVPLNIEVLEEINERLQLAMFAPLKNIFSGDSASFEYRIENIGNRGEVPRGKVRIFDRDGREIATLDANADGKRLEPSGTALLSSVWAANGSFGRYKAMLDLEYGNRGTLQDTVFFWVMPWGKLLSMFLTLVLACMIIALVFHSRISAQRGGYAYVATLSQRPGFFSRVKGLWARDDDEDEPFDDPDEEEFPSSRAVVTEMRQVLAPHPVRSRVPSFEPERTHLSGKPSSSPSVSSHRVTLGKRERQVSPHHVVNLRK